MGLSWGLVDIKRYGNILDILVYYLHMLERW